MLSDHTILYRRIQSTPWADETAVKSSGLNSANEHTLSLQECQKGSHIQAGNLDLGQTDCISEHLECDLIPQDEHVSARIPLVRNGLSLQHVLPIVVITIGILSSFSNSGISILALELATDDHSKTTGQGLPITAAFFNTSMAFILFYYSQTIHNAHTTGIKMDDYFSKNPLKKLPTSCLSTLRSINRAACHDHSIEISAFFLFAILTMGDVICNSVVIYKTTTSLGALVSQKKNALISRNAVKPLAIIMATINICSATLFESSFAIEAGISLTKQINKRSDIANPCSQESQSQDSVLDNHESTLTLTRDLGSKKRACEMIFPRLAVTIRVLACICSGINCLLAISSDPQTKSHVMPIVAALFNAAMSLIMFCYSDTMSHAKEFGRKTDIYFFSQPKRSLPTKPCSYTTPELLSSFIFAILVLGDVSFSTVANYQTTFSLASIESQKSNALISKDAIIPIAIIMTIITSTSLALFETGFAITASQHTAKQMGVYCCGQKKNSFWRQDEEGSLDSLSTSPLHQESVELTVLEVNYKTPTGVLG